VILCGSIVLGILSLVAYLNLASQPSELWKGMAFDTPFILAFHVGLYLAIRGRAWFLLKEHLESTDPSSLNVTRDEQPPQLPVPNPPSRDSAPKSYVDL